MDGAITGMAVKIIVISDMSRAASLPCAMSRTIARDSTIVADAPDPCRKRAASITSMSVALAATVAAAANNSMPA